VVVSVILTIALAWIQHQGEARSARDSLSLSLSSSTSFVGIDLHGRNMKRFYLGGKTLNAADLENARLNDAVLRGSSLRGANLRHAHLSGADLQEADLHGARTDLHSAKLITANLRLAKLSDADLTDADLRGADLAGADLRGANFRNADLRDANLAGADLRLAVLSADLRGAVFAADFRPARLDGAGLAGARWDETTRWPQGFEPRAAIDALSKSVVSPAVPPDARTGRVARVADGDTIVLEGVGVVRLLGIDAPQSDIRPADCFAVAATDDVKRLLPEGRDVRYVEGAVARDKFQRLLAYVWTNDGKLVNQEIVARGDARVLIVPPNVRYGPILQRTQVRAAGAGLGLWASC